MKRWPGVHQFLFPMNLPTDIFVLTQFMVHGYEVIANTYCYVNSMKIKNLGEESSNQGYWQNKKQISWRLTVHQNKEKSATCQRK